MATDALSLDPLAGTPYRTLKPLGAGAMGEVVEAEHVALGRRVVVKLLHRHLFRRSDLADRMRLEGEALGCVAHPNVVTAVDAGRTRDERPYLVMERLAGRTLREELLARGPLPAAEAVDLCAQALDGLSAVHAAGIVHRDIKLDNVFVCDAAPGNAARRRVKLLDLGVAKVLPADGARPAPLAVPTDEGVSMGTPRFFSPEQATGAAPEPRSDVYAMGLVLYALLTGRTPFDHLRAIDDVMRAHAVTPPEPPSRFAPERLPAGLEAAVLKALAKRAEDRFPGAAAFAAELRRIARGERAPVTPPRLAPLFFAVLGGSLGLSMLGTWLVHALSG
jgi:serine/threonine-protein kinase